MNKRGVNCSSFVFLFLIGMGILLLVITIRGMQAANESENWLSTSGVIDKTWLERDERIDADDQLEVYYKPHVQYSYQVNSSSYSSEQIDFGLLPTYSSKSRANAFLAGYPVGSQVEVFYDPAEPAQAVLAREASNATWGLVGGVALIILPIVAWFGLRIKGKRAAGAAPVAVTLPE